MRDLPNLLLIVPIGEWVIKQACLDAASWPESIKVAVNLSPTQFRNARLLSTIVEALDASGLPPSQLELEITETVLLANTQATLAMLQQIHMLGAPTACARGAIPLRRRGMESRGASGARCCMKAQLDLSGWADARLSNVVDAMPALIRKAALEPCAHHHARPERSARSSGWNGRKWHDQHRRRRKDPCQAPPRTAGGTAHQCGRLEWVAHHQASFMVHGKGRQFRPGKDGTQIRADIVDDVLQALARAKVR